MQRIALDAPEGSLSDSTLEALAGIAVSLASSSRCLVGLGAGVSTSAGIPDFRTPRDPPTSSSRPVGSGSPTSPRTATPLAAQATKFLFSYSALLHPDSRAAHLRFMAQLRRVVRRAGPAPAASRKGKERAPPEGHAPTAFHGLLRALDARGTVRRVYSQNIDGLERRAGLGVVDLASAAAAAASDEGESDGSDWGAGPSSPSLRRRRRGGEERAEEAPLGEGVVIPLHGGLEEVVCGACGWREKWRRRHSKAFRKGRTIACGRCRERANSCHRRSKRAIPLPPLAFLRPAVLLYDDPHSSASSAASLIASLAASDLTHEPDFLLVAGTSLRIPGFKKLVRRFAARARRNGGLCVLVNREAVGKEWEKVFDYHVVGDTDAFAEHMLDWLEVLSSTASRPVVTAPASPPFIPLPARPTFYPHSPAPSSSSATLSIPPTPPQSSPLRRTTPLPSLHGPARPAKRARSPSPNRRTSPSPDAHALPTPPSSSALLRTVPLPSPAPPRPRPPPQHKDPSPATKRRRAHARLSAPAPMHGMGAAELLARVEARAKRHAEEQRKVRSEKRARREARARRGVEEDALGACGGTLS